MICAGVTATCSTRVCCDWPVRTGGQAANAARHLDVHLLALLGGFLCAGPSPVRCPGAGLALRAAVAGTGRIAERRRAGCAERGAVHRCCREYLGAEAVRRASGAGRPRRAAAIWRRGQANGRGCHRVRLFHAACAGNQRGSDDLHGGAAARPAARVALAAPLPPPGAAWRRGAQALAANRARDRRGAIADTFGARRVTVGRADACRAAARRSVGCGDDQPRFG